jgi:hypothetical protein
MFGGGKARFGGGNIVDPKKLLLNNGGLSTGPGMIWFRLEG